MHRRVFIVSIIFFVIEIFAFQFLHEHFLIKELPGALEASKSEFSSGQQMALNAVRRIKENNERNAAGVYIFGGSVSRSLFCEGTCAEKDIQELEGKTGKPVLICITPTQNVVDILRLVDNIHVDDATLIFTIYPRTMLFGTQPEQILKSVYYYGAGYKYPMLSHSATSVLDDMNITLNIRLRSRSLMENLNIYPYFIRNYISARFGGKAPVMEDETFFERLVINDKKRFSNRAGLLLSLERGFKILGRVEVLARERGYRLVLFDLPYSHKLKERFDEEYLLFEEHLESFLAGHPAVYHYRYDRERYPLKHEYFKDGIHLHEWAREHAVPYVNEGASFIAELPDK